MAARLQWKAVGAELREKKLGSKIQLRRFGARDTALNYRLHQEATVPPGWEHLTVASCPGTASVRY